MAIVTRLFPSNIVGVLLAAVVLVVALAAHTWASNTSPKNVRHTVVSVAHADETKVTEYVCFWNSEGLGGSAMSCHQLP